LMGGYHAALSQLGMASWIQIARLSDAGKW